MKLKPATLIIIGITLLASCQKEVNYATGTTPGNPAGGSTNGELLVKALEITPATKDTNIVTITYDKNKRVVGYESKGEVNGLAIYIKYSITRAADGKITKAFADGDGFLSDSTVFYPTYVGGTSKLKYVLAKQYTFLGIIEDSTAYTYNTSNQMISARLFPAEFFGFARPGTKSELTYDANGNTTLRKDYSIDATTGNATLEVTQTVTFNNHKAPLVLGEESFIVLSGASISKNDVSTLTIARANQPNVVSAFSQQLYNGFDKPTSASLKVASQGIGGYDLQLIYFYK